MPGASLLKAIRSDVTDVCVVQEAVGVAFFEDGVVRGHEEANRAKAVPVADAEVGAA